MCERRCFVLRRPRCDIKPHAPKTPTRFASLVLRLATIHFNSIKNGTQNVNPYAHKTTFLTLRLASVTIAPISNVPMDTPPLPRDRTAHTVKSVTISSCMLATSTAASGRVSMAINPNSSPLSTSPFANTSLPVRCPVPATTRRNPLLTCSETQFLNDDYICEECTGRGIITPISSQLGVRWRWLYNCKWECLPSYYYFAESDELYYCYTWSEFKTFVQIESGDIIQIQNTQALFQTTNTPTQRQKVLPLFEWILCATIVSTTLLVVMIRA